MRKCGWAVAVAGLGSLALLTACGGSSPSSSASTSSTSTPTNAGQPSEATVPSPGTTVLIVQHSNLGWVLAEASGFVVYTYSGDTKGGSPTCTGSCAEVWKAVTGVPMASTADTLPGTLGTVATASGAKQITYNGYPLYTLKGATIMSTKGNGIEGKWHVVKLSAKDVTYAG